MVEAQLRISDLAHALDAYGLFDEALSAVSLGVFFAGEPAEEVGGFVVEQIRNEMMTDTDVGFAVRVISNLTFTVERNSHEHMTCLGALS